MDPSLSGNILKKKKIKKKVFVSSLLASVLLQPKRRIWLRLYFIAMSLISDSSVFSWEISAVS